MLRALRPNSSDSGANAIGVDEVVTVAGMEVLAGYTGTITLANDLAAGSLVQQSGTSDLIMAMAP